MRRVSNFLSSLKKKGKESKGTTKFNKHGKISSKLILNKAAYEKSQKRKEYESLYKEAKKSYKKNEPRSKKVFNVIYFVAAKDPEFVKELIKEEKDEELKGELERTFKRYL